MGHPPRTQTRRHHQQLVNSLLQAIDERRRRQLALAARGVTPVGMHGVKQEIHELRNELAAAIAASSTTTEPISAPSKAARSRLAHSGHPVSPSPLPALV
jgi:hypothetical protein